MAGASIHPATCTECFQPLLPSPKRILAWLSPCNQLAGNYSKRFLLRRQVPSYLPAGWKVGGCALRVGFCCSLCCSNTGALPGLGTKGLPEQE